MNFRQLINSRIVRLDGGMGTLLQAQGLGAGEYPERWNLTHPDAVTAIHRAYYEAGSHVVSTNTFGANLLKFDSDELEAIVAAAVDNARTAQRTAAVEHPTFVVLDIGPTGRLLKPLGDLDFEEAVEIFAATVRLGVKYGVDAILIETMNDAYETKAAVLAAKENSDLPVLVSNAYGEDGKLMTGATPAAMVALLEGLGVDALGANCSLGPAQLRGVVTELLDAASVPIILKPNAGLPRVEDGRTVYDVSAWEFAEDMCDMVEGGVNVIGGCCGTTPEYIHELVRYTGALSHSPADVPPRTVVSSYTHAVCFGDDPLLIGERINPTGKKRFKQALTEGDMDYILNEGLTQAEAGAHILDVNVGLPGIDEPALLTEAVCRLQEVCDLPLQIDTADPVAMESALRRYNGKPLINSVNGKRESMKAVFPLVKKYGGVVIALTLDEEGIPATAEGRIEIAQKILDTAETYGIDKKDIVFDTLTMAVSADPAAAKTTLTALKYIREEMGCHTSLGVSNVSFGLPNREAVNSTFFALALNNGLSAAIMNPHSAEMMKTYYAYRALSGIDRNCADYVAVADTFASTVTAAKAVPAATQEGTDLQQAIIKGLRDRAAALAQEMLATAEPMSIINDQVIPALNRVGEGFEKKTLFLPQLLMAAEAAQAVAAQVKAAMNSGDRPPSRGVFVLATVQGDIHDIGKNIVGLLLDNYGFEVIDLGRDVAPDTILQAVREHRATLVGLSALMTTTVPAMESTIRLLKEQAPACKVIVGGAVLTPEYAAQIGADAYGKDAMETVRWAEKEV
ncbi:MAG: homocysteine S-methyltransferase family protein [Clostridia bacterium]|nr:homocysteine S-methyltransferase family protein [Clostridia bacterium]